ncbi:heparin lyase I family protein [Winogradskyella sp.]|uniref:heparin lyase I family protein n=1 Tax=Winogradskyella sp. TaxID=1883156 RepID=UPI00260E257F|nr:heparin lyase I family protein [Winogradskyella sp.]
MNLNTVTPQKVLLLFICFALSFSCTKDSDLFSDYVLADTGKEIESREDESENEESSTSGEESSTSGEESSTSGEESSTSDKDDSSSEENPVGQQELTWNTDFETVQWSPNGSAENGNWEMDSHSEVRITNDARAGNQAIWLGSFNGHSTRNEIHSNRMMNWEEHWVGFSIKITEETQRSRSYAQFRNSRASGGVGAGVINPVTLRQGNPSQLYFQTSTSETNVDKIYESGASTGTQRHNFNYEVNEWVDIVIHWLLDPVDGYIEIWVDGEKIVDETGTTTYRYAHVDGEPYSGDIHPTIGVYWSSNNAPQGNAYYDEYKVWRGGGGTYEDVSPDGLSPNN